MEKNAAKQNHLERKRLEQFDRDMKRWEFMEQHEKEIDRRDDIRKKKYLVGRLTNSSNGYHILNAQIELSDRGYALKQAE